MIACGQVICRSSIYLSGNYASGQTQQSKQEKIYTHTRPRLRHATSFSLFCNGYLPPNIGCYCRVLLLPGFQRLSSSVTMSTPLKRLCQNSSRFSDSGRRPDIPAMTTSSMVERWAGRGQGERGGRQGPVRSRMEEHSCPRRPTVNGAHQKKGTVFSKILSLKTHLMMYTQDE